VEKYDRGQRDARRPRSVANGGDLRRRLLDTRVCYGNARSRVTRLSPTFQYPRVAPCSPGSGGRRRRDLPPLNPRVGGRSSVLARRWASQRRGRSVSARWCARRPSGRRFRQQCATAPRDYSDAAFPVVGQGGALYHAGGLGREGCACSGRGTAVHDDETELPGVGREAALLPGVPVVGPPR
jgi:hypothetical protein